MGKLNYEKVFNVLVERTKEYLIDNNRKSMVLGISGGIDSTVTAAICHEVSKQSGIPLIGRSLPIRNKEDEFDASKIVGEAFCNDFKVCKMGDIYERFKAGVDYFENPNLQTPIANGNIQARLRMTYLYNLASVHHGVVFSTDNQTEYQLGFWTLHGDVGDFDPLQDLWKTEVYELAKWMVSDIENVIGYMGGDIPEEIGKLRKMQNALEISMGLTPTDGLGISNSDLDQIGAKSYADVDDILRNLIELDIYHAETPNERYNKVAMDMKLSEKYGEDVVSKVWDRHLRSEFKRKKAPIYIERSSYED